MPDTDEENSVEVNLGVPSMKSDYVEEFYREAPMRGNYTPTAEEADEYAEKRIAENSNNSKERAEIIHHIRPNINEGPLRNKH